MKNSHPLLNYIQDGSLLKAIINQHGSPLYLYSANRIRKNLSRLNASLHRHFKKYHICYAVKSNSNPHLVQLMKTHLPCLRLVTAIVQEIHEEWCSGRIYLSIPVNENNLNENPVTQFYRKKVA